MHFKDLPVLGIGLAADIGSPVPNYKSFFNKARQCFDYFNLGSHYSQIDRIKYYIDDFINLEIPIVFHPLNFNVADSHPESQDVINNTKEIIEYTKSVWMGQDIAIWNYNKKYLGSFIIPVVTDFESISKVADKAKFISDNFNCPFLIENPPVNFAVGDIHMLDFLSAVSKEADCGIVLDIGHLISYQYAIGGVISELPIEDFPFDRVVEVHIAGLKFSKIGIDTNVLDQHQAIIPSICWEFFSKNLKKMTNLKGVTLEQENCNDQHVAEHLNMVRNILTENKLMIYEN